MRILLLKNIWPVYPSSLPAQTAETKKPDLGRVFETSKKVRLLNLGFFVCNVLANYWIKFFDLEFLRHGALVFICSVKVASTGT
tara:strand:- start:7405 stop:7656 length:252 start_codon:yes stop_codon:yes gene_type:complete